jgi:3-hydroxyethyl bacteriochlorophyllide a dehydrogenase
LETLAVVFDQPQVVALRTLSLVDPGPGDVLVQVDHSGISTGTERLLWSGTMPFFPGLGYPLVPGYEAVGRVLWAGETSGRREGELVFVAGSKGFLEARGLFGAQARTIVVPGTRAFALPEGVGALGVLFSLAATAQHAIAMHAAPPDLVVGHGALGRLVARLLLAAGAPAPTVWEINPVRREGTHPYPVLDPSDDPRKDYRSICDVSGANGILDTLVSRMAPGGEVVLAGFYHEPVSFTFPPAFMKELRLRIAAEFRDADLAAVNALVDAGRLDLRGLITHQAPASAADEAYQTAFGDPTCVKMVLDWRGAE